MSKHKIFHRDSATFPMSIAEAEAIIYGPEFFNVQRIYSRAKRNGEFTIKEAENNLSYSTNVNANLKKSFESKYSCLTNEIEDLFYGVTPNDIKHLTTDVKSKAFYSRPSSPGGVLESFQSLRMPFDSIRSLPTSPTLQRRNMSRITETERSIHTNRQYDTIHASSEPIAPIIDNRMYNTVHASGRDNLSGRKNYSGLPLKSHPLYRTTNICLSNSKLPLSSFSATLQNSTIDLQRSENNRINHLVAKKSFPFQSKNMTLTSLHKTPLTHVSENTDDFFNETSVNGGSNRSKRLTKQTTLPEASFSTNSNDIIEDRYKHPRSSVDHVGAKGQKLKSRFEPEKPLRYHIVGRTDNTCRRFYFPD